MSRSGETDGPSQDTRHPHQPVGEARSLRTQQRASTTHPSTRHPFHTPQEGRTRTTRPTSRQRQSIDVPPVAKPRAPRTGAPRGRRPRPPEGPEPLMLLRKEVIQPHLPVRLPCYDLVPITSPTFDSSLPQGVGPPASGVTDFRDLTGGVYKARERIHRSVADLRLLATPTSWGRVADPNPN